MAAGMVACRVIRLVVTLVLVARCRGMSVMMLKVTVIMAAGLLRLNGMIFVAG